MQREIKFRGLRTDGKGWVYGYLIKDEYGNCYIFNYWFIPAISIPTERFIEVLPESVGQFTGLKDKNGIEIYEADKIKYKNFKGYSTIVFENGVFGYYGVSCFITLLETNTEYIEITGNIHEKKILCDNLDENYKCKNMCLTRCVNGNKFYK